METVISIFTGAWATACAMAPYLLFGFLAAGILSVFLSPPFILRHLGGNGMLPTVKASLFGVPLPLCSCSVLPVAVSLQKSGASTPAAVSFLLSTPQTGVDSIFVTYSLLGGVFAIFRPLVAFITGIIGGSLVRVSHAHTPEKSAADIATHCAICAANNISDRPEKHGHSWAEKIRAIAIYAFYTLPQDIAKPLLIGLLIAGVIGAIVPDDFFATHLAPGLPSMLAMMVVGVPLYICSTSSVPIAAALIAKGLSPGAALVFLVTGAATNAAGISVIWRTMGTRVVGVYLFTVAFSALISGFLLDALFTLPGIEAYTPLCHDDHISPWSMGAAIVLFIILAVNIWKAYNTQCTSCCHDHSE